MSADDEDGMREDESGNRLRRLRARRELEMNPTYRANFNAAVALLRKIIGEPDSEPGWSGLAAAAQIAADLDGKD